MTNQSRRQSNHREMPHVFATSLRTNFCVLDTITEDIGDDTYLAVGSHVTQRGRVKSSLGENKGAIELIFVPGQSRTHPIRESPGPFANRPEHISSKELS
jgi:hypothetical protein